MMKEYTSDLDVSRTQNSKIHDFITQSPVRQVIIYGAKELIYGR